MTDVSILSEGELKSRVNVLRQQMDQKDRDIKNHYHEMSLHNKGAKELRNKRDECNLQVRELRDSAAVSRDKRNEVNKKIAELKKQKEDIWNRRSGFTDKIGEMKKARDDLNNIARGRLDSLNNEYREQLEKFSSADIPLEHEQSQFKRLQELGERLTAIRKANAIHGEMGDMYGKVNEFHQEIDTINALMHDMAAESQEHHESMLATYAQMDEIRAKSDEYHRNLVEIYELTNPIKGKIDAAKNSIAETREELDLYLDRMKDIQLDREKKKMEDKRVSAKDKFQKKGRLSLEDLRLLMENNELDL